MPEAPGKKISGAAPPVSRYKQITDAGQTPDMPPIDAEYLIGYLFDAGPGVDTGMGVVPLRSGDLLDWQEETGVLLRPWEAAFLRRLSREYLVQLQKAEKLNCPPPYSAAERRIIVAKKIDDVFGKRKN